MVNIDIVNPVLKDFKDTTKTSGRKESDYYKTYRDQNKEYFNKYSNTTTTLKKNYIESGTEQNTRPI
jgi:hypothetical protein